jgi:hypothetical protein
MVQGTHVVRKVEGRSCVAAAVAAGTVLLQVLLTRDASVLTKPSGLTG